MKLKYSVLVLVFISGCGNEAENNSRQNKIDSSETLQDKNEKVPEEGFRQILKRNQPGATELYYEPYESTLTGTLIREEFFGPPGYGEYPETDTKEPYFILYLDKKINIKNAPEEKIINDPHENVNKIQLVINDYEIFRPYLNKKVTVTGTLFSAHTGHHHTAVLLFGTELKK